MSAKQPAVTYPSGNAWPLLQRLDSDATGIEIHVSNCRTDAKDAAWEIRHLTARVAKLEAALREVGTDMEKRALSEVHEQWAYDPSCNTWTANNEASEARVETLEECAAAVLAALTPEAE